MGAWAADRQADPQEDPGVPLVDAYTTILTVSGRMEEKGLITRPTTGAAYNGVRLLTPAVTCVELLTHAVLAVCSNLNASADDRAAVLAVLGAADA